MLAAARFAVRCLEIEGEPARNTTEQLDLKQYCSAVVVLCAAAVEAFKNELLHDYIAEPRNLTQDQAKKCAKAAGMVPDGTPDPLRQVDGTLRLLGKSGLDLTPLTVDEHAQVLFYARNALMHYWPEWYGKEIEHKETSELLKSRQFLPNPFANPTLSFFPERFMGFAFARWSFRTALDFVLSAQSRAGVNMGYTESTFRIDTRLA